jgi:hypothetical protein
MNYIFKITLLLLLLPFGCIMKQKKSPKYEGIHYFESWAGYEIPFRPTGEISLAEAEKLRAYYIAHFENGLLIHFEKYIDQKLEWRDIYTYWPDTKILQKREMFHFDPTAAAHRIQNFDKKGNLIKE